MTKKAFTLIEMLIVISIITILAILYFVATNNARKNSKITEAKGQTQLIARAIMALENDTNKWPGSKHGGTGLCEGNDSAGLTINGNIPEPTSVPNDAICLSNPTDEVGLTTNFATPSPKWRGPYMASIPKDPWGNSYLLDLDYYNYPLLQSGGGSCPTVQANGYGSANGSAVISPGPNKLATYPCQKEGGSAGSYWNDDIFTMIYTFDPTQ